MPRREQSAGGLEASGACPGEGRLQTATGSVRSCAWPIVCGPDGCAMSTVGVYTARRLRGLPWLLPPEPPSLGHGDCGDAQLRSRTQGPARSPAPWALRRGGRPAAPAPCPLVPPLHGPSPGPSLRVRGPACVHRPGGSEVPRDDARVGPVGPGVWPPLRWSRDLTRPLDLQHLPPVRCPRLLPWWGFRDCLVPLCRWLLREPVPAGEPGRGGLGAGRRESGGAGAWEQDASHPASRLQATPAVHL